MLWLIVRANGAAGAGSNTSELSFMKKLWLQGFCATRETSAALCRVLALAKQVWIFLRSSKCLDIWEPHSGTYASSLRETM